MADTVATNTELPKDTAQSKENKAVRPPDSTVRPEQYLGEELEAPDVKGLGSAAFTFDRKKKGPKTEDIVKNYPWTTSQVQDRYDIPYIVLSEHRNTESTLVRQMQFYGKGTTDTTAGVAKHYFGTETGSPKGLLEVYDEIFPDNPTNNKYIFPYFSKSAFELNTSPWEQMEEIGQALGEIGQGASSILKEAGGIGKSMAGKLDTAMAVGEAIGATATTALKGMYPLVGINDRPRVFTAHSERTISIEFPLYNTLTPDAWIKNHTFIYKLMSQNLYSKRDFITGLPPVFYRVHVPYQYFCFAACVTKIDVQNLGNVRLMYDSYPVPDAYQVSISLQEMLVPSLNQFQALITGDANSRVQVVTQQGIDAEKLIAASPAQKNAQTGAK